jgi:hypothetical protein
MKGKFQGRRPYNRGGGYPQMADSVKAKSELTGIERAHTLASEYYVDAAWHRRECGRIFWPTWQCVGWREQVENAGDYFTFDLCGDW